MLGQSTATKVLVDSLIALKSNGSVIIGRGVPKAHATTKNLWAISASVLPQKRTFDFFCLNDGSFPEVSAQQRADVVGEFLQTYFPVPAPWERAAGDE